MNWRTLPVVFNCIAGEDLSSAAVPMSSVQGSAVRALTTSLSVRRFGPKRLRHPCAAAHSFKRARRRRVGRDADQGAAYLFAPPCSLHTPRPFCRLRASSTISQDPSSKSQTDSSHPRPEIVFPRGIIDAPFHFPRPPVGPLLALMYLCCLGGSIDAH